ncbi:hypothetical protein [Actibacterium sp. MT2.3-13A]|uniref:hypothetical protein n=1 Tax=Actibacterium sp. MT2.3-13A TaxID=2828332 RepID=UPI001BA9694B|nr:hypothetical protein [Actibacterium sp. MT2.3-13A]
MLAVFKLCWIIVLFCFLVSFFLYAINRSASSGEVFLQISYYSIATQDFAWLATALALLPALWTLSSRSDWPAQIQSGAGAVLRSKFGRFLAGSRPRALISACVLCLAVTGAGTFLVYHDFALSMDEFMFRFQTEILKQGHLVAPVPEDWFPLSHALRPGFLIVNQEYHFWAPGYRPGAALIYAVFDMVGLGTLMNPLLSAGCVWLVAALAAREWPNQPQAAFWAVGLLAVSPQFLITGMTPYTMTAHLFASLLWLYFFTSGRLAGHLAAIGVGCIALVLHHIHVHLFFALPFLLRLLFIERRFVLSLAYAFAYGLSCLAAVFWMDIAVWLQGLEPVAAGGAAAEIDGGVGFIRQALRSGWEMHGWEDLLFWAVNISRFVAWQNLAVLPLAVIALRRWRHMPPNIRLLAWSIATSLIPYILLMPTQGHGWGYRYLHPVLGNVALIAAFGWLSARTSLPLEGWQRLRRFTGALALVTLCAGLPLRAIQVEAFVRPFHTAAKYLASRAEELVFLDAAGIWYGHDLVRNDPLMRNRPKILALDMIDEAKLARLCAEHSYVTVYAETLRQFGIKRLAGDETERQTRRRDLKRKLANAGCED